MPTQYLPELLFVNGRFERDRALAVGDDGRVNGAGTGETVRLPGRALLPGLVNGHSHAFQRLLRGRTEFVAKGHAADDFWSWRESMYRAATQLSPDDVFAVSRQAFVEMALAGITTVGEFHYLHHAPDGKPYADPLELSKQVIRAAREVGLRIALLRVGYARAGFKVEPNPRQARFLEADADTWLKRTEDLRAAMKKDAQVSVALAPHSVRAVPRAWLEVIARLPPQVTHMHVAEQPAEIEACRAEYGKRPVELLKDVGLLHSSFTAVHAIHVEPKEIAALGKAGATVCACPSTERNLGDGIVPADGMFEARVDVSLGSDSQASIDVLDEARQLESHLRLARRRRAVLDPRSGDAGALGARLFGCATRAGAKSLGLDVGDLSVGSAADFFTVDLNHPSIVGTPDGELLSAIVFGAEKAAIREVAVQGRLVVREGRHTLAEESAKAYSAVVRRLADG